MKATRQTIGNKYHSRAAAAIQRDADNLRKNGYKSEAEAVQKVADKHRAKAQESQRKYDTKIDGKKRVDKAIKKLQKTKIKDLEKRYGELEDSMEYGKKTDSSNNRKIQTEMNSIENEIRKMKNTNK